MSYLLPAKFDYEIRRGSSWLEAQTVVGDLWFRDAIS